MAVIEQPNVRGAASQLVALPSYSRETRRFLLGWLQWAGCLPGHSCMHCKWLQVPGEMDPSKMAGEPGITKERLGMGTGPPPGASEQDMPGPPE